MKLCLLCWQNSGICLPWQPRKRERKLFYWRPQKHLLFQLAATCFRGKWVMELGCSHCSAWALTMQPQSGPSEQDYTPAVKNKLLSQSRIPFLEWEQWTGRCVGSGGEVSPRGWCRHPWGPGTNMGSLTAPVTRGSCQAVWRDVGRCPRQLWGISSGRFGEVPQHQAGEVGGQVIP